MRLPPHHAQAVMDINRAIVEVRGQLNKLEREVEDLIDRQTELCRQLAILEDEKRGSGSAPPRISQFNLLKYQEVGSVPESGPEPAHSIHSIREPRSTCRHPAKTMPLSI